ncbi:MAG TPA: hypothetical protein VMV45_18440, partial [Casimicrobiaceae bacterium]|nr:hypothetical protein [Casimicrobiaceae bacterium]
MLIREREFSLATSQLLCNMHRRAGLLVLWLSLSGSFGEAIAFPFFVGPQISVTPWVPTSTQQITITVGSTFDGFYPSHATFVWTNVSAQLQPGNVI